MEKLKRILALIGVVVLILCYVMSMITAIMATPEAHNWFIASIGATILVPVVLYAYSVIMRVTQQNQDLARKREDAYLQQMKQQMKKQANECKGEDAKELDEQNES